MQLSTLYTFSDLRNAMEADRIVVVQDIAGQDHGGFIREFTTGTGGVVTGYRLTSLRGYEVFLDLESTILEGTYDREYSQAVAEMVYG